ncbi:MAG: hypothetical protein ACYC2K_05035 [Gemmatimonadales bacterium]
MAPNPTIDELVAIHLRFDPSTEALGTRAVAELIAKVLFAEGRMVSKSSKELGDLAARVFKVPRIDASAVDNALAFLKRQRLIREPATGRWQLTESGYSRIETDRFRANARLLGVLDRHFPLSVGRTKIEAWFADVCVGFYGLYGTQWAAAIARRSSQPTASHAVVKALLDAATQRHSLKRHESELSDGFFRFIGSTEPDDVEHQWSLGQSLLAAKLVAAQLGPDPITAQHFRGVVVLLDTNMLLVAALEAHRLAGSISLLAAAFQALGVDLEITEDTRAEYTRVVHARRIEILPIVEKLPIGFLRGTADAFVDTALDRGCSRVEDFARFFDGLLDPPRMFGEVCAIRPAVDPEILQLAARGREDEQLKADIQQTWAALRTRKRKGVLACEHDAALTVVAENYPTRACCVLTLDRTMQEHSLKRTGTAERTVWLSLEALIQELAVDSTGPSIDPAGFAPLMASIIRQQCEPVLNTYTPEDLALMLDLEERCASLPELEVRQIAAVVARSRLAGARRDDPELRLSIQRAFQKSRRDAHVVLGEQLQYKVAEARTLDKRLSETLTDYSSARAAYVNMRASQIKKDVAQRRLLSVAFAGVASLVLAITAFVVAPLASELLGVPSGVADTGVLLAFLSIAATPASWYAKTQRPRLRRESDGAEAQAEAEFERTKSSPTLQAVDPWAPGTDAVA